MTPSDKLREIAEKYFPIEEKLSSSSLYNQIQQTNQVNLLSDLTALISEGYYPKEFTRWFRSEKFYDIFEESTDGEDNTQWEYLPSGQI